MEVEPGSIGACTSPFRFPTALLSLVSWGVHTKENSADGCRDVKNPENSIIGSAAHLRSFRAKRSLRASTTEENVAAKRQKGMTQTKVVPSAITYLCFCVVTSGFPAVLIGVVVILTYIFAASPCDEPAMWLPCIPSIPRSEYFYDSVSQDCLPKDMLPIGCLSWNEVPGAMECWDNCRKPHLSGKPSWRVPWSFCEARRAALVKATCGQAPDGSHPHTARRSPPGEAGSQTTVAGATLETNGEEAHSGLSREQLAISFPNGTRFGANIATHNRSQLIDMGEEVSESNSFE
ncbi:hypothetical protein HPB47_018942 [Ixodes persulcatus]|uniref:Uncharacterized protein n=1 Tax=Ixodes persulcatus TaxID=34615 RepID=A0AC60QN13_IXOPE|nr:hypothetical protein HPB47_018942 [Ixodes persulcatus]